MGAWGAIIMSFFGAVFGALTLYMQWHKSGLPLMLPFLVFAIIAIAAARVIRLPGDGVVPSERRSAPSCGAASLKVLVYSLLPTS